MKLGMVTYNLGRDWDLETLITHCEEADFAGVELRTTACPWGRSGAQGSRAEPRSISALPTRQVELVGIGQRL